MAANEDWRSTAFRQKVISQMYVFQLKPLKMRTYLILSYLMLLIALILLSSLNYLIYKILLFYFRSQRGSRTKIRESKRYDEKPRRNGKSGV